MRNAQKLYYRHALCSSSSAPCLTGLRQQTDQQHPQSVPGMRQPLPATAGAVCLQQGLLQSEKPCPHCACSAAAHMQHEQRPNPLTASRGTCGAQSNLVAVLFCGNAIALPNSQPLSAQMRCTPAALQPPAHASPPQSRQGMRRHRRRLCCLALDILPLHCFVAR